MCVCTTLCIYVCVSVRVYVRVYVYLRIHVCVGVCECICIEGGANYSCEQIAEEIRTVICTHTHTQKDQINVAVLGKLGMISLTHTHTPSLAPSAADNQKQISPRFVYQLP